MNRTSALSSILKTDKYVCHSCRLKYSYYTSYAVTSASQDTSQKRAYATKKQTVESKVTAGKKISKATSSKVAARKKVTKASEKAKTAVAVSTIDDKANGNDAEDADGSKSTASTTKSKRASGKNRTSDQDKASEEQVDKAIRAVSKKSNGTKPTEPKARKKAVAVLEEGSQSTPTEADSAQKEKHTIKGAKTKQTKSKEAKNKTPVRRVKSEKGQAPKIPFERKRSPAFRKIHKSKLLQIRRQRVAALHPSHSKQERLRQAQIAYAKGATAGHKPRLRVNAPEDYPNLPSISAQELALNTIPVPQPPVARLAHGLERVLFNPGVSNLRDPRTRVFNFDPHLEKLMPVQEFNFQSLNIFTPPSKDATLAQIAKSSNKKYVASTSSLTGVLKHFHFLLSRWRPPNLDMLSKQFPALLHTFTMLQRAPEAIFLRWKDGQYAVDSDKMYDSPNVLSLMGRYMEKLLTMDKDAFARHRVGTSNPITDKERREPEAFHYSTLGDFILRSQLDAQDPRLPGAGIFDLKTRAVVPIRMDSADFHWGMDYEIRSRAGQWQSFEREYHDMIRSTLLKYSLQVRMGRMDGIFVAFHNIARIFGFQYISLEEMDAALHGQEERSLGDQEFLLSIRLVNEVFDRATKQFPEQTLRIHLETREGIDPFMYVFAEPVTEEQAKEVQSLKKKKIEDWERKLLQSGSNKEGGDAEEAAYNVEGDMTSELLPFTKPSSNGSSQDFKSATDGQSIFSALFEKDKSTKEADESSKDPDSPLEFTKTSGPILALQLKTYSTCSGKLVARPKNPHGPEDTWSVHYDLSEVKEEKRAWQLYNACRARRHKAMDFDASQRKAGKDRYFMDILKRITGESKKWRKTVDEQEERDRQAGREPGMWNDVPAAQSEDKKWWWPFS